MGEVIIDETELERLKDAQRILNSLDNCNNCALNGKCVISPGWGGVVRYNCAFWQPIEK